MRPIQKKFILQLSIVYMILNLALFAIYRFSEMRPVKASYLFVLFFAVITSISFFMVSKTDLRHTRKFNNQFMLSFGIRFFTYLLFALVYLLIYKPDPFHFVALYFVLYIVFTVLEVKFLVKMVQETPKI